MRESLSRPNPESTRRGIGHLSISPVLLGMSACLPRSSSNSAAMLKKTGIVRIAGQQARVELVNE